MYKNNTSLSRFICCPILRSAKSILVREAIGILVRVVGLLINTSERPKVPKRVSNCSLMRSTSDLNTS